MNTYAAIALGAVGLAVLCAIGFAFRRVVNDRAPLPFFRMLARRGLDATQLEGAVGPRQLALAVRRCAQLIKDLAGGPEIDRKSTRLNSSHRRLSRMPSSA